MAGHKIPTSTLDSAEEFKIVAVGESGKSRRMLIVTRSFPCLCLMLCASALVWRQKGPLITGIVLDERDQVMDALRFRPQAGRLPLSLSVTTLPLRSVSFLPHPCGRTSKSTSFAINVSQR